MRNGPVSLTAACCLLIAGGICAVPHLVGPGAAAEASEHLSGGAMATSSAAPLDPAAATDGRGVAEAAASSTSSPPAFAYVEKFNRPVPLGAWPSDGSAPRAYPTFLTYPDRTGDTYFPSRVLSVHDGVLDWFCHGSMGAAVLPFGYTGFQYGTYTVRMRTDDFQGYRVAFLLWPNSGKWTHELDGPEEDASSARPYPAVLLGTTPTWSFAPSEPVKTPQSWHDAAFHDYTWQWSPEAVSFYQDGALVTTVMQNVPQEGMHPVLQVQFANALRGAKPDPGLSGHVYVDRIMYDPSYTISIPTS